MIVKLRGDALDWRMVEGEIVVLDLATSIYLAVNGTGAALWPKLIEGVGRDELVELLVEGFDVSQSQAVDDIDAFLLMLRTHGLLEEAQADQAG